MPAGGVHLRLDVRGRVLAVVDVDLDLPRLDLPVDHRLVCCGRVAALADRVQERLRRQQPQPERLRERSENRLGRTDRRAGVLGFDRGRRVEILLQVHRQHRLMLLVEIAGVLRVEFPVRRTDRVEHLSHVRRRVPPMRVAAGRDADDISHGDHHASGYGIGRDQLRRPAVVPDTVDEGQLRRGHRPRIRRGWLVVVRVGVRVVDDARDLRMRPAQLCREAAPEVLGGDHLDQVAGGPRGSRRGGGRGTAADQRWDREDRAADDEAPPGRLCQRDHSRTLSPR